MNSLKMNTLPGLKTSQTALGSLKKMVIQINRSSEVQQHGPGKLSWFSIFSWDSPGNSEPSLQPGPENSEISPGAALIGTSKLREQWGFLE